MDIEKLLLIDNNDPILLLIVYTDRYILSDILP